jgi:hypothetical protein
VLSARPAFAQRVEHPRELPIGFAQDVQIPVQIVGVGRRLAVADEIGDRRVWRRFVGMVSLLRPSHDEERPRRILPDVGDQRIGEAAIFDTPRRDRRGARQRVLVAHFVEAARRQECPPSGPAHVAGCHEGRAVAALVKEGRERRPLDTRILLGEIAKIQLRVDRQQERRQRIRAATHVGVKMFDHQAPRRFLHQVRRRVIDAAERRPSLGNRLQHEQHDIHRPGRRAPGAGRPSPLRRRRGDARFPLTDRFEIGKVCGWKRVRKMHRPLGVGRLPPRHREHPRGVVGDPPVVVRDPVGCVGVMTHGDPDREDGARHRRAPPTASTAACPLAGRDHQHGVGERHAGERQHDRVVRYAVTDEVSMRTLPI